MPVYSDLSRSPSKGVLVVDIDAIRESFENALQLRKKTRLFRPWLHSELDDYLFEPCQADLEFPILVSIMGVLEGLDPRIVVSPAGSNVKAAPDQHQYLLNISYYIKGLEGQFNFSQVLKSGETT